MVTPMTREPGMGPGWTMYARPQHELLIHRLSHEMGQCAEDCREFAKIARTAQIQDMPAKFGLTWEEFCEQRLHQSPDFVEAILIGLETLGEAVPIPAAVALKMGRQVLKSRARVQQAALATAAEAVPEKQGERVDLAKFAKS